MRHAPPGEICDGVALRARGSMGREICVWPMCMETIVKGFQQSGTELEGGILHRCKTHHNGPLKKHTEIFAGGDCKEVEEQLHDK